MNSLNMAKWQKILGIGLVVAVLVGAGLYYKLNAILFDENTNFEGKAVLFIPTGADLTQVIDSLNAHSMLRNMGSFKQAASWMGYEGRVKSGRYELNAGSSNRKIINKLKSGNQNAIKLTFNNVRNIAELAGVLSHQLELDSLSLLNELSSETTLKIGSFNQETILSMFIPNTYEVYWNTTASSLIARMKKEYDTFWSTNNRSEKAQLLGLNPTEVYTLASIVEKESNLKSERPTLAAVYLNRIKQGIPLQADPTVVYAIGDFDIRRVLKKHLEIESPYNTYINLGLPPGPIYMPSINSIDAVLANEQHEFIFFCAKPGYNAGHNFAKTNAEHARNARIYHDWLSKENIR